MALRTILNTGRKIYSGIQEECILSKNMHSNIKVAPLQKAALEERCILIDEFDKSIGEATKKYCHLISKEGSVPLHRAFSVFLFNANGDLLLQKRSSTKITFPDHFTNTCCSHPLAEISGESEEHDALGVRKAAQRRLNFELGIPLNEILPNDLFYLTRIHYQALGESCWGEHEIDYILFAQKDKITLDPNPDEISEIRWIPRSEIENFIKTTKDPLTPWFKLISEHKLTMWWDNLNNLEKFSDHSTIHRFL
ncbi:isopentenyl-diphosphate Delta-isomerase 1 [Leptopilina heterotoma]|uniref:isopentenyl-diphosphate Delta-isomerase 1 n=1 Tax=Leptopilina heterotoma TaxID=63436 RepID=UPI001CA822E3|nr:isopentenyl-diphosphate Delta-isomerase 1 [Leptopilina heterotoma]